MAKRETLIGFEIGKPIRSKTRRDTLVITLEFEHGDLDHITREELGIDASPLKDGYSTAVEVVQLLIRWREDALNPTERRELAKFLEEFAPDDLFYTGSKARLYNFTVTYWDKEGVECHVVFVVNDVEEA